MTPYKTKSYWAFAAIIGAIALLISLLFSCKKEDKPGTVEKSYSITVKIFSHPVDAWNPGDTMVLYRTYNLLNGDPNTSEYSADTFFAIDDTLTFKINKFTSLYMASHRRDNVNLENHFYVQVTGDTSLIVDDTLSIFEKQLVY